MGSSKRALDGLFWTISGTMLNAIFGFVSVPILINHYGKGEYALIALAFSVNVYLRLMDMGMSSGNVKFFSQWIARNQMARVSKLFQSSLVFYGTIGLINAAVLGVVSFFARQIWGLNPGQVDIVHDLFYVLMVSAFFGWVSNLFDQFLRANEIIGWEQRLLIFVKIIQVVILVLTIKYDYSVGMYVMLQCFSSLLILPFTIIRIRKLKYKVSFIPKYHGATFKQVMPYSISLFYVSIFQFSAINLRPILLSLRVGLTAVTDYNIINSFATLITFVATSFVGVLMPMATKAVTLKNTQGTNKIAYEGTKYISIFLAVIIFGFVMVSKDLLIAYVGPQNEYLVKWLDLWALTLLLQHTAGLSSLVYAENNMRPVVYMSAFSTITSLLLAWFIIPYYSFGGVIYGYLYYCAVQTALFYFYYYRKILKLDVVRIFFSSFLVPTLILAVCAVGAYYITLNYHIVNKYFRILAIGGTFLAVAAPVIYFIILNFNDKAFIVGMFKKDQSA